MARIFFNKCLCSPCRKKDICKFYPQIAHEQKDVIRHLVGVPSTIKMVMWVTECPFRLTNDEYDKCKSKGGKTCEATKDGNTTV